MRLARTILIFSFAGLLVGLAEAALTAIGSQSFWRTATLHFLQAGFGFPFLGALVGYIVWARRRRKLCRELEGLCSKCGYNLTGLTESRCPECGTRFEPMRRQNSSLG